MMMKIRLLRSLVITNLLGLLLHDNNNVVVVVQAFPMTTTTRTFTKTQTVFTTTTSTTTTTQLYGYLDDLNNIHHQSSSSSSSSFSQSSSSSSWDGNNDDNNNNNVSGYWSQPPPSSPPPSSSSSSNEGDDDGDDVGLPSSAAGFSYLDALTSAAESYGPFHHRHHRYHHHPKPKATTSGGGGGGNIPCGRGPLGSYLDGIVSSTTTAAGDSSSGGGRRGLVAASGDGDHDGASPSSNDDDDEGLVVENDDDDDTESGLSFPSPRSNNLRSVKAGAARGGGGSYGKYLQTFWKDIPERRRQQGDELFFLGDDSRTDVRSLLTQRSIQGFMRLCEECRDPHSAKWVQEVFFQDDYGNLMDYHGTGAKFIEDFGGRWDTPLLELTKQPITKIVVSSKRRGRGHGGWSKNNPYLQERWVEMDVVINPTNLVHRIIQVREHLAYEWYEDIQLLLESNEEILNIFYEGPQRRRNIDDDTTSSSSSQQQQQQQRLASYLVSNNSRFSSKLSSPYRRSNFDLIQNLSTQAAIHRLLRDNKHNMDESFEYLRDYYQQVANQYFDGDVEFGQANIFLYQLLHMSPRISDDGRSITCHPMLLAEFIVQKRRDVVQDWKQLLTRVPEDHTEIRQRLYETQFHQSDLDRNNDDPMAFQ